MITVSEIYLIKESGTSKLCADVIEQGKKRTLWFEVDSEYEKMLCTKSGECFVMGLLPYAMQQSEDIFYKGQLSERFVHGLNEYLIPSIAVAREQYYSMKIHTTGFLMRGKSFAKAVGAYMVDHPGFYEMMNLNGNESLYPVTHLCVFDASAEENAKRIAENYALKMVKLHHNFEQLYTDKTNDIDSFLNLAGALALSGGLKMFLYHSQHSLVPKESKPKEQKNLDLILCSFASTDSIRIYLFDCEKEGEHTNADN